MIEKKSLADFRMPRWNDLPPIDLYLEQVMSLIDEWLGEFMGNEKKRILTKTMINNYVKQKFIDPPVNKKYSRKSVASLFVVAVLKQVYTMDEIARLIKLADSTNGDESAYDDFCQTVEDAVHHAFRGTTMPKPFSESDPRHILWNACNSFACQLYVRNIYLQRDEKNDKI